MSEGGQAGAQRQQGSVRSAEDPLLAREGMPEVKGRAQNLKVSLGVLTSSCSCPRGKAVKRFLCYFHSHMEITAHCDLPARRLLFHLQAGGVHHKPSSAVCAWGACARLGVFKAGQGDEWDARAHLLHFKRPPREHLVPVSGGEAGRLRPFKLLDGAR